MELSFLVQLAQCQAGHVWLSPANLSGGPPMPVRRGCVDKGMEAVGRRKLKAKKTIVYSSYNEKVGRKK